MVRAALRHLLNYKASAVAASIHSKLTAAELSFTARLVCFVYIILLSVYGGGDSFTLAVSAHVSQLRNKKFLRK